MRVLILVCVEVSVGEGGIIMYIGFYVDVLILVCVEVSVGEDNNYVNIVDIIKS